MNLYILGTPMKISTNVVSRNMFCQTRLQVLEPSAGRWHPLPVSCSVAFLVGGPRGQWSFNNLPRVVNGKHLHDLLWFVEAQALSRSRCYPAAVRYAEGVWLCGGLTRRKAISMDQDHSRPRHSKVCRIWKDMAKMMNDAHISYFMILQSVADWTFCAIE